MRACNQINHGIDAIPAEDVNRTVIAFAVLVTVLIWPGDHDQTVAALSTPDWPLFVTLGVVGAGMSFFLYIVGLHHTEPAVASIVAMIEPVTASLLGVMLLNESLAGLQLVGMGLILVSATVLSVYSSTQWRPSDRTTV